MKRFIIRKEDKYSLAKVNACEYVSSLDHKKSWVVEIKRYVKKRSNDQNAYIHAVPFKILVDHTGYTIDEMKEYLCGEFTGWEEYEMFGRRKVRPLRTTSQMDTLEMTNFIEWMQWWASTNLNIRIPSPNEYEGEY